MSRRSLRIGREGADPLEGRRGYVKDCGLAEETREGRRNRGREEKGGRRRQSP